MYFVNKLLKSLIILHLLNSCKSMSNSIFVENKIKYPIIEKVSDLFCHYKPKLIYVYFGNTSLEYSNHMLQRLCSCSIPYIFLRDHKATFPLEDIKDDGVLMYLAIVLHNSDQQLELSILQKKSTAKHLTHVFLIIQSEQVSKAWLHQIFRQFWRIWILNAVIIYWRNNQLHIYRYSPFNDNILIRIHHKHSLPQLNELFPKTLPNMHGKPLRMCIYADDIRAIFNENGCISGSDGFMSAYIAERLNATRIVRRVSRFARHNLEPCLTEIESGLDDIAINIRFLALSTFYHRVEFTISHSRDDLCVLVPKANPDTIFWNFFGSFNKGVWIAIVITLFVMYFLCKLISKLIYLKDGLFIQIFATSLSMPMMHIPNHKSLRLLFLFWIAYNMLINGAFKCNLMSNLLFRNYLPDINTIKELAVSPYELLLFERHVKHFDLFLNTSFYYDLLIKNKLIIVPDKELLNLLLANNVSYAYVQKEHVLDFQVNARQHIRFGRPIYHKMSTCIIPFHAVFIVPYGSPYLGFVNNLIRSSHEFGFYIHWERRMSDVFLKTGKSVIRNQHSDDDPVVLNLAHFQVAFCLLSIGLLISLLKFVIEFTSKYFILAKATI